MMTTFLDQHNDACNKNLFDESTNIFTIITQDVIHNDAFNKNLSDETTNIFTIITQNVIHSDAFNKSHIILEQGGKWCLYTC